MTEDFRGRSWERGQYESVWKPVRHFLVLCLLLLLAPLALCTGQGVTMTTAGVEHFLCLCKSYWLWLWPGMLIALLLGIWIGFYT